MLVAISGSQGSGKSTVLQQLEKAGYETIQRKTSRSVLDDWGLTLSEVYADMDLAQKFQHALVERKNEDEQQARVSDQIVFTERTFADLFTYGLVVLGHNNAYSDFIDDYQIRCMQFQQTYDLVFYLNSGHFAVEHDGVRGSNPHYSKMVDLVMREYTERMTHPSRLNMINVSDKSERALMIINQSRALLRR